MKTIEFEDQGQDFLEWDLDEDDVVIDSRPFQAEVWRGTFVQDIKENIRPILRSPRDGEARQLNYKVIDIRAMDE